MPVADITINTNIVVALSPVILTFVVGLLVWIVREMSRISTGLTQLTERGAALTEAVAEQNAADVVRDGRFSDHVAEDAKTARQVARIEGILTGPRQG